MLRAAALQFVSARDVDRNLATCLRLIEAAVGEQAVSLLVLPEFSNHPPVLDDGAYARSVAASWDGPFLSGLRQACVRHRVHLAVGVSLLDDAERLTSSALLIGPDGEQLARVDRQVLSAELAVCYVPGECVPGVIETPLGRLALCVGADLASLEMVRATALGGAQLVCGSLAPESARDASLHLVARAAENRLFILAASGASGAAGDEDAAAPAEGSQCIAPDGTVIALAAVREECLVGAQIDAQRADDKLRADGTDVLALRRPELYRALFSRPRAAEQTRDPVLLARGPARVDAPAEGSGERVEVALLSNVDAGSVEGAIESAAGFVRDLAGQGATLVVLPELFCFEQGVVHDPDVAAAWFAPAVRRLAEACARHGTHVLTSLVEQTRAGFQHMGVLLGHAGIVARAAQVHVPKRHAWAVPGNRLHVFPLPWGKLGVLIGEDAIVPEAGRTLALLGADVLAIPSAAGEPWEAAVGFAALAIENGVAVAAALRESEQGGSVFADPHRGPQRAPKEQALLRVVLHLHNGQQARLRDRPQRMPQGLGSVRD